MTTRTDLYTIVSQLMQPGKGLLAADESDATAEKRLALAQLPNSAGNRQDFRELLFTAPGIEEFLSGAILFDSTMHESTDHGVPFVDVLIARGIVPGIKVDAGNSPLPQFPGEVLTEGLDRLGARFKEYFELGARFAKWRGVVSVGTDIPTDEMLELNAHQMAVYSLLAQEAGIVPIVEPEVLFPGSHSIRDAEDATTRTLTILFKVLSRYRVDLKGLILKSSMVLAGDTHEAQSTPDEVAAATLRTFKLSVPREVGGIVFLSGGQTPKRSTENLQAIASYGAQPWPMTFSYSRAVQEPVLTTWQGKSENIPLAQKVFYNRLKLNSLAQQGKYDSEKDK